MKNNTENTGKDTGISALAIVWATILIASVGAQIVALATGRVELGLGLVGIVATAVAGYSLYLTGRS